MNAPAPYPPIALSVAAAAATLFNPPITAKRLRSILRAYGVVVHSAGGRRGYVLAADVAALIATLPAATGYAKRKEKP